AEASYLAAPFLDHPLLDGVAFIHVVRHPVKVALSFLNDIGFFQAPTSGRPHESFVYQHVNELGKLSNPVDRAVHYYLAWNRMILRKTRGRRAVFHRIEDGPAALLGALGLPPAAADDCYRNPACNTWPQKTHRYGPADVHRSAFNLEMASL